MGQDDVCKIKIQKYLSVFFNYRNDCKINACADCFMRHLVFYQLAIKVTFRFEFMDLHKSPM